MRKYIKIVSLVSLVAMLLALQPVFAKNDKSGDALPEQDGIYDVPKHPELKVRVFVHNSKPGKPTPPAPACVPVQDPDSEFVTAAADWHLPQDFTYYLNTSSVPSSVKGSNLETIAENAFGAWLSPLGWGTNHYLGITSVNKAAYDKQNIITWGRTSASALGVTYIWYNQFSGEAVEIDTVMNSRYAWTWSDPESWTNGMCAFKNSYDAQDILTHELGHWFGLDDEYGAEYADNTMYGYGSQMETKKDTLSWGDVAGLQNIYHSL